MKQFHFILCFVAFLAFSPHLRAEAPLLENSFNENPIASGWTIEGDDFSSSDNWSWSSYSNNMYSGATYSPTFSDEYILISPEIILDQRGADFSFNYKLTKASTCSVYVLTNGASSYLSDLSSAIALESDLPVSSTYIPIEKNLNAYKGQTIRLAFVHKNITGMWYIDDISVVKPPLCPKAKNLSFSNLQSTSVTLNWANTITDTYKLMVCSAPQATPALPEASEVISTTDITVATNNYNITGLTAGTTYYFYLRTNCTSTAHGMGEWSEGIKCFTPCIAQATPYSIDFDTYTNGDNPSCWVPISTQLLQPEVYVNSSFMSPCYRLPITASEDAMIVLPMFSANAEGLMVTMRVKASSENQQLSVGLTNDITDASAFLTCTTQELTEDWAKYTFFLNNSYYTGPNYFVAIYAPSGQTESTSTIYQYIDDIEISVAPNCLYPLKLNASKITDSSVELVWEDKNVTSMNFTVEYTSGGLSQTIDATSSPFTLTGLTDNSDYSIKLRTNCTSSSYSDYSDSIEIHTFCTPIVISQSSALYMDGFEDLVTSKWQYKNDDQENMWTIGNSVFKDGTSSIYPTSDLTSKSWSILSTTSSSSFAYCDFNFTEAGRYKISYDWKGSGDYSSYIKVVGVPTDLLFEAGDSWSSLPATAVKLMGDESRLESSYTGGWEKESTFYDVTTPGVVRVVFYWYNSSYAEEDEVVAIDNFEVLPITCPRPSSFDFESCTATSATFNWLGTSSHYSIKLFPRKHSLDSIGLINTDAIIETGLGGTQGTVNGLTKASRYYSYIQGNCTSTDESKWIGPIDFLTQCGPQTLPYYADFNSAKLKDLPLCWIFYTESTSAYPNAVVGNSSYANIDDSYYLAFKSSVKDSIYALLPEFSGHEANELLFSFDCTFESVTSSGKFIVGYFTDMSNLSTFVRLDTINQSKSVLHKIYDLTSYNIPSGARLSLLYTKRIVPASSTSTTPYYAGIDNVELILRPSCLSVSGLKSSNLEYNSATIEWISTAGNFNLEYGLKDFVAGTGTSVTTTDNNYTFSGLLEGTEYTVRIQANCGASVSKWKEMSFITSSQPADATSYNCGFEDLTQNLKWMFANDFNKNGWEVGNKTSKDGTNALYIVDNVGSIGYSKSTKSYSWAYIKLACVPGEYSVAFDWKNVGESTYDYVQAVITPDDVVFTGGSSHGLDKTTIPNDWITIDETKKYLSLQRDWKHQLINFSVSEVKNVYLAFYWKNDGGGGVNPAAQIDNVTVSRLSCAKVANFTQTALNTNSATVSWQSDPVDHYKVRVASQLIPESILDTVTRNIIYSNNISPTAEVSLSGLVQNSNYYLYVKNICSATDSSEWSNAYLFTTPCSIKSVPYSIDFDTDALYKLPACWGNLGDVSIVISSTYKHGDDGYSLKIDPEEGKTAQLVSPQLQLVNDISEYQVSFYAYLNDSKDDADVQMAFGQMDDLTDNTTFSELSPTITLANTEKGKWKRFVIPFSHPLDIITGQPKVLANEQFFIMNVPGECTLYIDDFSIEHKPSCPEPYELVIKSITPVGCTFDWSGSSSLYQVSILNNDIAASTKQIIIANQDSLIISTLSPHTNYNLRVRALCSSTDTSRWSDALSFSTECEVEVLPFEEGFENLKTPTPVCWSQVASSTYHEWGPVKINEGALNAIGLGTSTTAYSDYTGILTTPVLDLTSVTNAVLTFDGWMTFHSNSFECIVMINQVGSAVMDTIGVFTDFPFYERHQLDLTPYAGQFINVNFFAKVPKASYAQSYVCIDNVKIIDSKYLEIPKNITLDNITATSVQVHITADTEATSHNVYVIQESETLDISTHTPTVMTDPTSVTITGLASSTKYKVYVQAVNGTSEGLFSEAVLFSTNCEDALLPVFETFEDSEKRLPLCWTDTGLVDLSTVVASDGTQSLRLKSKGVFITPRMVEDINTMELFANIYSTGALDIGVCSDPMQLSSTYTFVETLTPNTDFTLEYNVDFTNVSTGNHYIVITAPSATNVVYIDNLQLVKASDCDRPDNVELAGMSSVSATFSITDADATSFDIAYGPSQSFSLSGSTPQLLGASSPAIITGLNPNTNYVMYVRSNCSTTDHSAWYGPIAFTTDCDSYTISKGDPFTEDLKQYRGFKVDGSVIPSCWSRLNSTDNKVAPYAYVYTEKTYDYYYDEYKYYEYLKLAGTASDTVYLVSPKFTNSLNELIASIQIKQLYSPVANDSRLELGVMSDAHDASTFVSLGLISDLTSSYFRTKKVDLRYIPIPTDCHNLAIRAYGSNTSYYLDNIKLEIGGNNSKPINLKAVNITQNAADLSVNCVANSTKYEMIVWNQALAYSDTLRNLVPVSISHISDLQSATEYKVKARSFSPNGANEDTTAWSDTYTFYTLQVAASIPYVCDFENSSENANWISMKGDLDNYWMIASGFAKEGTSSLFVTNDGLNPAYNDNYTFIWAYRLLAFDRGNYDVSFYAKVGGDDSYDFMRVFLIPDTIQLKVGDYYETDCDEYNGTSISTSSVPDQFIEITDGSFRSSEWTEVFKSVFIDKASNYRLAFMWKNSAYSNNPPSALIDSIVVVENTCPTPINLTIIETGTTSVKVSAETKLASPTDQIRYVVIPKDSILDETNIVAETVGNSGDTVTISNLNSNSSYKIYIAKICGTSYSIYSDFKTFNTQQIPASIPYICGFENTEIESSQWKLLNDTKNEWVVDTIIAHSGKSSLYISENGGSSHKYNHSLAQYSYAVRSLDFEVGEFNFDFEWMGNGETTHDYSFMYVIPSSVDLPKAGSSKIGGLSISSTMTIPDDWYRTSKLNLRSTWQHKAGTFAITQPGMYNIVFLWVNDHSVGTNPPIAIDNFQIKKLSCSKPIITLDKIGATAVTASFTTEASKVHAFLYDVTNSSSPVLMVDTVTTESVLVFDGLSQNTSYKLLARSLCSASDSSHLSPFVLFTTDCAVLTTPFYNDFNSVPVELECWTKYEYLINSDTTLLSDLVPSSSTWLTKKRDDTSQHLYVNIYGTSRKHWLVSPSIEVSKTDFLKFDVALTDYGKMSVPDSVGYDDVFAVMVSRDQGTTWTSLQTWDQEASTVEKFEDLSEDFTTKSFALTSKDVDTIKFAFYAASNASNADNSIRIDNVAVSCIGDTVFVKDSICSGYAYTRNGFNIKESKVTSGRFSNLIFATVPGECDYIKVLDLVVSPIYDINATESICQGQSYSFGGVVLTKTGDYINTLTSSFGCDSLVHLHLDVVSLEVSKDTTLCEGQSLVFGRNIINSSGAYVDTVRNAQGCDSITHLYVTVIPMNISLIDTICEGDFYQLGNLKLTKTGIYHENLQNRLACDSIVTLDLSVIKRDSIMTDQFCEGSSFNFRGKILKTHGLYIDTVHNYLNSSCDRIYKLTLSETKPDTVYISDQFCEGDLSYNNYGFGLDNPVTKDYPLTKQSLVTACDSVTILQLSEIATINTSDSQSICDGDFINWGGSDYGAEGIYTHTFESSLGCDSIVELTLSVNPTYDLDINDTVLVSNLPYSNLDLTVPVGTSPGDYQFQVNGKTRLGCDSIINLDLHIDDNIGLTSITINDLMMYPTSVKAGEFVYIRTHFTPLDKEGMTIQLYNTVGKVIKQYVPQSGSMKFNMPSVAGIYYMHINLQDGTAYVGKIIVY